ncbi:MAG TPA: hypothetical protein DCL61_13590 [Cyanobacteria bacterium UBA12227]|nr:hypothetical protein [Cyanobacteria bacterium UBA12227]HBY81350.1 hypothetical protein [Cyanobacteria bacterium UBA11148]
MNATRYEPLIDLQSLLNGVYERAGYDLVIDYTQDSIPPLLGIDITWADALLKEQQLR